MEQKTTENTQENNVFVGEMLLKVACEQALSCGVGGWREEERELTIMSHKFEFRPRSP